MWCVVTTLHRSHVWPALMVSCRLVEAAAAVAATLTGLLLSNWWIILLLIWPPKAGNSRLFLTVYKLLLCHYTLWKKKNIQLLFTEELVLNTIYRSCHSRVNLWTFFFRCDNDIGLKVPAGDAASVRVGIPSKTVSEGLGEKTPIQPLREK